MKKLIVIILLIISAFHVKSAFSQIMGTYAIVNSKTGLSVRPMGAASYDGNKIIMFTTIEWKCETWDFSQVEDNTYTLKNLYTSKSFQPADEPIREGSFLIQQKANINEPLQHWEFVKSNDGNYKIKLCGTDLFLTSTDSKEINSPVFLEKENNVESQLWRLVAQSPKN